MKLLIEAFALAAEKHAGQARRLADFPFVYHPMSVAALVLRYGGDEAQAAAALVHDLIDRVPREELERRFGHAVAQLAFAFADPEIPGHPNPGWDALKTAYLKMLRSLDEAALLVVACEELHELRELSEELGRRPAAVRSRVSAPLDKLAWYYRELQAIFLARLGGARTRELAEDFASALGALGPHLN